MPLEPPTSLEKQWGVDKQNQWKQMRVNSIAKAVNKYKEDHPSFQELYDFLTQERVDIAKVLSPRVAFEIATARRTDARANLEQAFATMIADEETYADFLPALQQSFNEMTKHVKAQKSKFLGSMMNGLDDRDTIKSAEVIDIKYGDTPYSKLTRLQFKNSQGEEKVWIRINHTPGTSIPDIMDKVARIYDSLPDLKTDYEKIQAIKAICWHLAHAMPRVRGSAAICEMMMETLLQVNGIPYTAAKPPVTMDLIAIFCYSPEDFANKIVLNPEIELKHELGKFLEKNKGFMNKINIFSKVNDDVLSAAVKLQQHMSGKNVEFTAEEINVMRSEPLKNILQHYPVDALMKYVDKGKEVEKSEPGIERIQSK